MYFEVTFEDPENNEKYKADVPEADYHKINDGDLQTIHKYFEYAKELDHRRKAVSLLLSENHKNFTCHSEGDNIDSWNDSNVELEKGPGISVGNLSTEKKDFIWSSKTATEKDKEATQLLLDILGQENFQNKLRDKKTKKKQIFTEIYNIFLEKGFIAAGNSQEGQERIHQKWRNLERSYINYENNKRQTGAKKISEPPFYDLLYVILGDKHKVTPPNLLDSLTVPTESSQNNIEDRTSEGTDTCNSVMENNEAKVERKVKPIKRKNKRDILEGINETLKTLDEKQEQRFARLEKVLLVQNEEKKRSNDLFELFIKKKFKMAETLD